VIKIIPCKLTKKDKELAKLLEELHNMMLKKYYLPEVLERIFPKNKKTGGSHGRSKGKTNERRRL